MNALDKLDIWRFSHRLPDYYDDLATLLESAKDLRQLQIFMSDASRYAGSPRGRMSQAWAERYANNGADLAATWQGYMPDDDVAILRVQQDLGGTAVIHALRDLGKTARVTRDLRSTALTTLGLGVFALLMAIAASTVLPVWAVDMLQRSFDLTPDKWGPTGRQLASWAQFVTTAAPVLSVLAGLLIAWVAWSPANWVGPGRRWADKHLLLYRAQHEITTMRMAMTMATLARKNGSTLPPLRQSLETLLQSASSKWTQSQIERTLEKISETGGSDHTVFGNGVFTQEIYWRLEDICQAKPLSEAMLVVADTIPKVWLPRLVRQMAAWRWVLLIASLGVVLVVVFTLQTTIGEMKTALMNTIGI